MRTREEHYPVQSSPAAYWGPGHFEGCPPILDWTDSVWAVTRGATVSRDVVAGSNNEDSFVEVTATGLPSWAALTGERAFVPATFTIGGTIPSGDEVLGDSAVVLTAMDSHGTSTRSFTLRVS